ncbi:MAG: hypothetical protein Q7R45_08365 [Sulfuricaulis sp.]|nr:hypothetical protein [Sulfuricaulis sp.]
MEWILVPKKPTPEMLAAMRKTMPKMADKRKWVSSDVKHLRRWNAAISSAPKHPTKTEIIQRAIYAALGCTKIDYRSGKKIDEAAEQITRFVEAALAETSNK